MKLLLYISLGILLGYVLVQLQAILGLLKLRRNKESSNEGLSVMIPFRNEATRINSVLNSIKNSELPKNIEFVFVDDHSTDNGSSIIVDAFSDMYVPYTVLKLEDYRGKKSGIDLGVEHAKFENIVTLDADCVFSNDWYRDILDSLSKFDVSIGSTYKVSESRALYSVIQIAESEMLGALTVSSAARERPILASGANLAYKKSTFKELNPYHDNMQVASGDDMFLLEKARNGDRKIGYHLAQVETKVEPSFKDYLKQISRWSSKVEFLKIPDLKSTMFIYGVGSFLFLVSLILFSFTFYIDFLWISIAKLCVDLIFFIVVGYKINKYTSLKWLLVLQVIYPFILILVVGYNFRSGLDWKERSVLKG